jgi:hypothetical protein
MYSPGPLRIGDEPLDWEALQNAIDRVNWAEVLVPRENLQKVFALEQAAGKNINPVVRHCLELFTGDPPAASILNTPLNRYVRRSTSKMMVLALAGVLPLSVFTAIPVRECKTLFANSLHGKLSPHPQLNRKAAPTWQISNYWESDFGRLDYFLEKTTGIRRPEKFPINVKEREYEKLCSALSDFWGGSAQPSPVLIGAFTAYYSLHFNSTMLLPQWVEIRPLIWFVVQNFMPQSTQTQIEEIFRMPEADRQERESRLFLQMASERISPEMLEFFQLILRVNCRTLCE